MAVATANMKALMTSLVLVMLTASADEAVEVVPFYQALYGDHALWELTVVSSTDMIDMPERYELKVMCVSAAIKMHLEDDDLQGFICELERP